MNLMDKRVELEVMKTYLASDSNNLADDEDPIKR